eukprot:gnl/MRDRNA2_/MRDRNA2_171689_c0_seq1.p1 gnl/MRDRNA2_/MRDRNA2_171689_c0~~gnl/MRDRNA2_/MRDRNA2_171689_c0_seq1.p1  ORF type:complete len:136 (+),score=18.03 gnl/MRDRNA2_/MRDRNA2_171689_c0_seq1:116-523(+)
MCTVHISTFMIIFLREVKAANAFSHETMLIKVAKRARRVWPLQSFDKMDPTTLAKIYPRTRSSTHAVRFAAPVALVGPNLSLRPSNLPVPRTSFRVPSSNPEAANLGGLQKDETPEIKARDTGKLHLPEATFALG